VKSWLRLLYLISKSLIPIPKIATGVICGSSSRAHSVPLLALLRVQSPTHKLHFIEMPRYWNWLSPLLLVICTMLLITSSGLRCPDYWSLNTNRESKWFRRDLKLTEPQLTTILDLLFCSFRDNHWVAKESKRVGSITLIYITDDEINTSCCTYIITFVCHEC